jgi:crotonobetainyl-CoA:carnitine CoA-transferase CaiB-like acyl-CoA transferase
VADGALTGLLVLDLSENISGPYCTKLLADYSATVIKIEKPRTGDASRHAGPFPLPLNAIPLVLPRKDLGGFCRGEPTCSPTSGRHTGLPLWDDINTPDIEQSGLFLLLNTSKKSVTLDIKDKSGREIFKRLVKQADIVVENSKPGTMKKLGIDYETIGETNPALIMASISYFGQTGPCRDWNGSDIVAQAMGGLMHLTGEPDKPPLNLPLSQAEYQAGLNAAVAILCAVFYRDTSGEGQYVDISVQEAVASILEGAISTFSYSGKVLNRTGVRHRYKCPSTIMKAEDRYIHMESSAYWDHFATMVEAPELLQPPLSSIMRYRHADRVEKAILPWVKSRTADEIFSEGQDWRMPVAEVMGIDELDDDPQYEARNYFQYIDHPATGMLRYPGAPFRMSETPAGIDRAPLLGEHNVEIYRGILGLSKDEMAELKERNVI